MKSLPVTKPPALPEFFNMGLGAIAGAGKTHLIGTPGKGKRILNLDFEGGTTTYSSKAFKTSSDVTDNIDVINFDDVTDATSLIARVEGILDYLIVTKNKDKYDVVAIDSLTELQEKFLSLHKAPDKRQSYGAFRDSIYSIVHKARLAPVHTIFTARLKATQDDVLNREVVRFEVSPGAWGVISGLFDIVAMLDVKRVGMGNNAKLVRVIDAEQGLRFPGKDRIGIHGMTEPTMAKILSQVGGTN
jgi:hypothetical protein